MELLELHHDGVHALTKVDPRVKLVSGIVLLVMTLSYKGFVFPAVVTLFCLSLCAFMRVPPRRLLLRFTEPLFIVAVLVLLKFFFSGRETSLVVHLFGLTLTGHADGLHDGLLIACRIIGAVSIIAAIGFSTPFSGCVAALSWLRVPRTLLEVSLFAYRYIFLLLDDAVVIYSAQKNRLGYAGVRRGLSSFGILAGSLTLRAYENSQRTATAMEQRGYDGSMPVTMHEPFRGPELMASAVLLIVMAVIWKA